MLISFGLRIVENRFEQESCKNALNEIIAKPQSICSISMVILPYERLLHIEHNTQIASADLWNRFSVDWSPDISFAHTFGIDFYRYRLRLYRQLCAGTAKTIETFERKKPEILQYFETVHRKMQRLFIKKKVDVTQRDENEV